MLFPAPSLHTYANRHHIQPALSFLRSLPADAVHCTVTDPAYESQERHRAKGTTARLKESKASSNQWFGVMPNADAPAFFEALYRAHAPRSYAYVLCDDPTADVYKPAARAADWWVWPSLTWVKVKADGPDLDQAEELTQEQVRAGMGYHWRRADETILVLEKRTRRQRDTWNVRMDPLGQGRKLNHLGWPSVLTCPIVRRPSAPGWKNPYPTEKPVPLLRRLIENSTQPGEIVLDPFAGSGATGVAAAHLDRRWILSDISPGSLAYSSARQDWPMAA